MSLRTIRLAALACLVIAPPALSQESTPLDTVEEKLSYSAGVRFGKFLEDGADLVDRDALIRGLSDAIAGGDLALSEEELDKHFNDLQQRMAKIREERMSAEGNAFLEANATKEGVVRLPSGLQYKVLEKGAGPTPASTDTVTTHYSGTLLDGTVFDSSYERGEPTSFPVNRVIPGWTEALQLMQVGDKWELYIPTDLAYGSRGAPPVIPPFATLVFQIELISIDQ